MNHYHYRAVDASGRTVSGVLEAGNLAAAEERLRADGAWMLDARESARTESGRPAFGRGRVPRGQLIAFFVEMSLLLRAGITLPRALERLAEDFRRERIGPVLLRLLEQVTTGMRLHEAMEEHPRVFPTQVVAMIEAGEVSGRLPEVFESLTTYYQWLDQLAADVRQATIYPVIVTGATLALVLGLFTFIVPRFVELLQGLSLQVPWITRLVMALSRALMADGPALAGTGIALALAFRLAQRHPRCARARDRMLMRLPVFGPLVTMFALSRFAQNLGMLHRNGIPLLRGLEICTQLAGNRAVSDALEQVRDGVAEGAPLSRCLARYPFFPPSLVTMIAAGEASGRLEHSLQSVSDYYGKIIPRRIKTIFAIFDPLIMVTLVAVVGGVALAVVLPILQLWQAR